MGLWRGGAIDIPEGEDERNTHRVSERRNLPRWPEYKLQDVRNPSPDWAVSAADLVACFPRYCTPPVGSW